MRFFLTEAIGPYHSASRSVNTFTTKQDVSPAPVPIIEANKLQAGTKFWAYAAGDVSTTGTPTLTLGFWFGTRALTITGDIAVASALSVGTAAAWPWEMEWIGMCTGTGAAGTLLGQGKVRIGTSLTTFAAESAMPPVAANRAVAGFDTTIERAVGVSAAFSASSASNQVVTNNLLVVVFN